MLVGCEERVWVGRGGLRVQVDELAAFVLHVGRRCERLVWWRTVV